MEEEATSRNRTQRKIKTSPPTVCLLTPQSPIGPSSTIPPRWAPCHITSNIFPLGVEAIDSLLKISIHVPKTWLVRPSLLASSCFNSSRVRLIVKLMSFSRKSRYLETLKNHSHLAEISRRYPPSPKSFSENIKDQRPILHIFRRSMLKLRHLKDSLTRQTTWETSVATIRFDNMVNSTFWPTLGKKQSEGPLIGSKSLRIKPSKEEPFTPNWSRAVLSSATSGEVTSLASPSDVIFAKLVDLSI